MKDKKRIFVAVKPSYLVGYETIADVESDPSFREAKE